tara:strand:- start:59 stop:250 length:192 start_codon:yes stop_codon:yes gene_type:complete
MNVKHVQNMNIKLDRDVHFMNPSLVLGLQKGLFVREKSIHLDCGSVVEFFFRWFEKSCWESYR